MRRLTGGGRRGATALVGVAAVLVLAAGCGSGTSSDGSTTTSASPPTTTPTPTTPGDPSASTTVVGEGEAFSVLAGEGVALDLDELATNLSDRLVAAGHADAAVEVAGDRVTVDPGDGPLDQAALEDLLSTPGRLEMRPVLEVGGTDCDLAVPTGTNEVSIYPELDDTGAVVACYSLAPTGLTNDAVEDASATFPQEDWVVNLVLTPAGIDTFNELAAACSAGASDCPTRIIAIAVDGVVVSAPTVNEPEFERDLIQISGVFTEAEAKALAAALRVEPLPSGLEVVP